MNKLSGGEIRTFGWTTDRIPALLSWYVNVLLVCCYYFDDLLVGLGVGVVRNISQQINTCFIDEEWPTLACVLPLWKIVFVIRLRVSCGGTYDIMLIRFAQCVSQKQPDRHDYLLITLWSQKTLDKSLDIPQWRLDSFFTLVEDCGEGGCI